MEDKVIIKGYHGTSSKHLKNINHNGLNPDSVKRRQDHWLGQGVYFYEDMEQAEWWANNQCAQRYNKGTYPIVYSAKVTADKSRILDLDDRQQLDRFMDFILQTFKDIEREYKGEKPEFDEASFRAVYFDYYKQLYDIAVVVCTFNKRIAGYAKARTHKERRTVEKFSGILGVMYHEKQICVSDKECIRELEIVYNGEEEVI